nr:hypothetical protein [Tanacetum cinerariifolium]
AATASNTITTSPPPSTPQPAPHIAAITTPPSFPSAAGSNATPTSPSHLHFWRTASVGYHSHATTSVTSQPTTTITNTTNATTTATAPSRMRLVFKQH